MRIFNTFLLMAVLMGLFVGWADAKLMEKPDAGWMDIEVNGELMKRTTTGAREKETDLPRFEIKGSLEADPDEENKPISVWGWGGAQAGGVVITKP